MKQTRLTVFAESLLEELDKHIQRDEEYISRATLTEEHDNVNGGFGRNLEWHKDRLNATLDLDRILRLHIDKYE